MIPGCVTSIRSRVPSKAAMLLELAPIVPLWVLWWLLAAGQVERTVILPAAMEEQTQ